MTPAQQTQRPRLPLGALNTASRIGLVYMASSTLMEAEMYAMATPAATVHTSRVTLPSVTVDGIDAMMRSPELRTAVELVAQAPLDVLVFGGTSASFLHGTEWDRMLVGHLEEWSGLEGRCTTTSTASIAALKAVGAGPISLVTPYRQEVIDRATRFFGDNGHPVVASVGLGITSDWELAQVPLEQIYDLAVATDTSESSAVFISCTNFASVGAIAALETALGKPVISAVQASFWYALEIADVHAARPGFGTLMDNRLAPATGDRP
ncbi:Asp/Glu racemase [Mycobacterium sp. ITM-2016-00317]|uniref:maleate cis-trans isomerase family protein n=1 Tax=Mycobacterium sp. ITM-2016-00317 TaxID=2099694 RepID=UPI00287F4004|nr:Asp/Glu racemase [Mycobacterium sp. ITM-2016-00317]WNG90168.1 Asp/Glu racemase [Mycobacterium sp. ITM-2016-00317]